MSSVSIYINNPHDEPSCGEPHDGKPISTISISPSRSYLFTYSEEDETIIEWCVEEDKITRECNSYRLNTNKKEIRHMCASDGKILAVINEDYQIGKIKGVMMVMIVLN